MIGQKRLHAVVAEIGLHRHGITAELLEDGRGIGAGRVPDITALGIGNHWHLRWDSRQDLAQQRPPLRSKSLKKGQVRLVGTGIGQSCLYDLATETYQRLRTTSLQRLWQALQLGI